MDLYSPGDCFVVTVVDAGAVRLGDPLITLKSPNLEKMMDRAKMYEEEVNIHARRLTDGRRDEIKDLQTVILELVFAQEKAQQSIYKDVHSRFVLGTVSQAAVDSVSLEWNQIRVDFAKQKLVVSQFDKETADLNASIASKKKHVAEEIARITELQSRMTIKAPIAGTFDRKCAVGMFFELGAILGNVQ